MDPEDSPDGAPSTRPADAADPPERSGTSGDTAGADDPAGAGETAGADDPTGAGDTTGDDDPTGADDPFVYGAVDDDAVDAADGDGGRGGADAPGGGGLASVVGRSWHGAGTFRYVLVVTAFALAIRLVGLGTRIFHWDEARVGYWILRYHETGSFSYRPIIHGPFLPIVNDYLFAVVPPSDFAARLPVALVGGLLPLAALLFRSRLRDEEVVALSLLLAANPLVVYYSRFMRNDVLVAAFATFALGFAVVALDTGRLMALVPSGAALGLAFAAKENALLYLACFVGAGVLLLDHRLVRATAGGRSVRGVVFGDAPRTVAARLRRYGASLPAGAGVVAAHLALGVVAFFAVAVFFYAPRPDLWQSLGTPGAWPGLLESATVDPAEQFYDTWASGNHQSHDYLPYLYDLLETIAFGAPVVLAFAAVGTFVDRYAGPRGFRGLVAFATYWGVASLIGYPIATDIRAPWAAVHVAVPLAIPAAVGIGFVYRALDRAVDRADTVSVALAGILLLAAATGTVAANAAYANSTEEADGEVLQWAQPGNDLKESLADVEPVVRHNEGTDVLFYGTTDPNNADNVLFYVRNESSALDPPPGGPSWHSRLPLPWYLERYGAAVNSTPPEMDPARATADAPPVVIAYAWDREELAPHLDGYRVREHPFKLWGENVVVFVDESALREAEAARAG